MRRDFTDCLFFLQELFAKPPANCSLSGGQKVFVSFWGMQFCGRQTVLLEDTHVVTQRGTGLSMYFWGMWISRQNQSGFVEVSFFYVKLFSIDDFFSSHSKVHKDIEKNLKCDLCEYKTTSSSHLQRHRKSHTKEKNLQCPYCAYKCSDMEYLRKHILQTNAHPGKFLYNCEECKSFKTNFLKEFNQHIGRCKAV